MQPGQVPSCLTCGEASAVVPSPTYIEADIATFERIEAAVRPAQLSRADIERVLWELNDSTRRVQAPASVLLSVVDYLPTLHFLVPAMPQGFAPRSEQQSLTRATSMLLTIVRERLRDMQRAPTS